MTTLIKYALLIYSSPFLLFMGVITLILGLGQMTSKRKRRAVFYGEDEEEILGI